MWTSYHTIATKSRRLLQNKYTECYKEQDHNDFPNIMWFTPSIEVLHTYQKQMYRP